ncbi:hypothetical protein JL721_115 [Aureococcus anophagefferens]|nr:hypothetical protein JL721_115 [Aureococcus anophagefferens]
MELIRLTSVPGAQRPVAFEPPAKNFPGRFIAHGHCEACAREVFYPALEVCERCGVAVWCSETCRAAGAKAHAAACADCSVVPMQCRREYRDGGGRVVAVGHCTFIFLGKGKLKGAAKIVPVGAGDELCRAAYVGDVGAFGRLLDGGAPVDGRDGWGETPLGRAATRGRVDAACKKIRNERAAEAARAEAPTPPPSLPVTARRVDADEVRARIAAEHEAARARREENPEPDPISERFGSRCPICMEEWDVNDKSPVLRICCCRLTCESCAQKIGLYEPCPLCRAECLAPTEALAQVRRHVENEVPEMVKFLGDAYHHGGHFGLVKSDKKAAKLYKKAVEQYGCVDAMYSLGEMYDTGDGTGVKLDKKKAMQLFRMAADRLGPFAAAADSELDDVADASIDDN